MTQHPQWPKTSIKSQNSQNRVWDSYTYSYSCDMSIEYAKEPENGRTYQKEGIPSEWWYW